MKASRPSVLLALALGSALAVWAVLRISYADIPPLPWTAVPTLLLLGLGEIVSGINLRNKIHHKVVAEKAKPVDPLSVARMAVLGKATALAASVLTGVFGGFVLYLAPKLDQSTPRHDFTVSTATAVAALVLVGAALFLEYCCRIPKDPDDAER